MNKNSSWCFSFAKIAKICNNYVINFVKLLNNETFIDDKLTDITGIVNVIKVHLLYFFIWCSNTLVFISVKSWLIQKQSKNWTTLLHVPVPNAPPVQIIFSFQNGIAMGLKFGQVVKKIVTTYNGSCDVIKCVRKSTKIHLFKRIIQIPASQNGNRSSAMSDFLIPLFLLGEGLDFEAATAF